MLHRCPRLDKEAARPVDPVAQMSRSHDPDNDPDDDPDDDPDFPKRRLSESP